MTPTRLAAWASIASFAAGLLGGAILALAQGELHAIEIVTGSALGAMFFGLSAMLAAMSPVQDLKNVLLRSYVAKAFVLAGIGTLLGLTDFHRLSFAVAVTAAAFGYLAALVTLSSRSSLRQQ